MIAGFQFPEMPFGATVSNTGLAVFSQKEGMGKKSGVIFASTFTNMVGLTLTTHWLAAGVNVYKVFPSTVVSIGEFQLPVIGGELVELVGKTGGMLFSQSTGIAVNTGVTAVEMAILSTWGVVQVYKLGSGENVYVPEYCRHGLTKKCSQFHVRNIPGTYSCCILRRALFSKQRNTNHFLNKVLTLKNIATSVVVIKTLSKLAPLPPAQHCRSTARHKVGMRPSLSSWLKVWDMCIGVWSQWQSQWYVWNKAKIMTLRCWWHLAASCF